MTKETKKVIFGKCTWRYALVDGVKTDIYDAERGRSGICPICGEELIPRKGELREWHWGHKSGRKCDAWYEPKGEWHRWWQNNFEKRWQEFVLSKEQDGKLCKHIADVFTPDKWTIEFQYSHLKMSDIQDREDFYVNILWVVNGTRLQEDHLNGMRWKRHEVVESRSGFQYFKLDPSDRRDLSKIEDVNPYWRDRGKLVFFDFDGTFDNPLVDTDLFCLLPGEVYGSRIVVRLTQNEFVKNIRSENVKGFVDKLLSCKTEYCREYELKLQQARAAEERRKKEENDLLQRKREEEWLDELNNPALYAVTCSWVEGLLVKFGFVKSLIRRDWDLHQIPTKGKMALHITNNYSVREYWDDIRKGRDLIKGLSVPKYEILQKCAGMVIAKFDYETVYCADSKEWNLVVEDVESLKNFEGEERSVYNIDDRAGVDVWQLSKELIESINDRKYKEIRNPKCPRCGAEMFLRRRNSDNGPFYGCSAYPKCNSALSCNKYGQVDVGKFYRLHDYL